MKVEIYRGDYRVLGEKDEVLVSMPATLKRVVLYKEIQRMDEEVAAARFLLKHLKEEEERARIAAIPTALGSTIRDKEGKILFLAEEGWYDIAGHTWLSMDLLHPIRVLYNAAQA